MLQKEYLTTGYIALLLSISPRTACRLIDSGTILGTRVGVGVHQERRVHRSDLLDYCHRAGFRHAAAALESDVSPTNSNGAATPPAANPAVVLVGCEVSVYAALRDGLPACWNVQRRHGLFGAGILVGRGLVDVLVVDAAAMDRQQMQELALVLEGVVKAPRVVLLSGTAEPDVAGVLVLAKPVGPNTLVRAVLGRE